jgi:hypothetical protein
MSRQQTKRAQVYRRSSELQRRNLWNTYTQVDLVRIAKAIGMNVAHIDKYRDCFEAAAWWYRAGQRRPIRTAPSKMQERMERIVGYADRLLRSRSDAEQVVRDTDGLLRALGIEISDDAWDGVGDNLKSHELFETLASVAPAEENVVADAIKAIGCLRENGAPLDGVAEIRRRAIEEAGDIKKTEIDPSGIRVEPKGNQSDASLNDWIARCMELYKKITGKAPRTSVGKAGRPREGIACGPFIRFLMAAGRPLQNEREANERHRKVLRSEDALRSRVRRLGKHASLSI